MSRVHYLRAGAVQRFGAPTMGAMGSLWDFVSDAADAISDAASWVTHGISDVVDAMKKIPGLGAVVGLVEDFSNTPLGKIFFSFVAPGLLTSLFSSMPGVGLELGQVLANPVLQNMLPGLVRGERVDRAFIASAKTVMNRILANGGVPAEVKQYAADGLGVLTDTLKSSGIDMDKINALVKSGQDIAQDVKDRAEAIVGPQLAALSKATGIPEDMLRSSLDGLLRVKKYEAWLYDKVSGVKLTDIGDLAQAGHDWTQDTIDAWLTNPHTAHSTKTNPDPIFFSAADVLYMAQNPGAGGEENEGPAMFGGTMGTVDLPYVYARLHALAATGQRPDEDEPVHVTAAWSRTMQSRFASDAKVAASAVNRKVRGVSPATLAARVQTYTPAATVTAAQAAPDRRVAYAAAGGAALLLAALLLFAPKKGT